MQGRVRQLAHVAIQSQDHVQSARSVSDNRVASPRGLLCQAQHMQGEHAVLGQAHRRSQCVIWRAKIRRTRGHSVPGLHHRRFHIYQGRDRL